jgi:hypothetical protein
MREPAGDRRNHEPLTLRRWGSNHIPKFVEGFADKLQVPAGAKDVQVFDDELPGYGIRKFASGKVSYFVKYNVGDQQRRKTLGAVVKGSLKAMRLETSAILAKARLGIDIVGESNAAAAKTTTTLGDLMPKYLKAREDELREKSHVEITRYLERTWMPPHKLLSTIERGYLDTNPTINIAARARNGPRERVLTEP